MIRPVFLPLSACLCLATQPAAARDIGADDPPDFASYFGAAEIVVLGEVHDNPFHHANQARAVAELSPSALVFEMITPAEALKVTPDIRGNAAALAEALGWENSGWPDFSMYYPIFASAPDAAVFGGGVPREDARRAVTDGAAAIFGDGAEMFGLDLPLGDAELGLRVTEQREAHCGALPEDLLPGMVEAQRLRDAALARAAIAALAEARAEGGWHQVVVITGNGHAREDWGVSALLRAYFHRERQDVGVASLGQFETVAPQEPPYRFWLVTEAAERDDPCESLR